MVYSTCSLYIFTFQKSAQFLRKELPIRIARRVVDFQKLPHIVLCNPIIHDVVGIFYCLYMPRTCRLRELNTMDLRHPLTARSVKLNWP